MTTNSISVPAPDFGGLIPTMNKMGWMTSELDPISEEFTRFASTAKAPVLEIGTAYGVATLQALSNGATVFANDADPRHLQLLEEKVGDEQRSRLKIMPGYFPEAVTLANDSVSAILASRVLHFFSGEEIEHALNRCHDLLQNQGRLFVIVDTPFVGWLNNGEEEYLARVQKNMPWPGVFIRVQESSDNDIAKGVPELIHLFTHESFAELLVSTGFRVDKWQYIDRKGTYPDFACKDGRESLGFVATKI